MDQDLTWWAEVVFADWRSRPGPRYARLAAALLEAVEQRTLTRGTRVPAERVLAATVGASRGTVVACLDQLVQAGVLTRRQGAGTYVAGRPSWAARAAAGSVATRLLRYALGNGLPNSTTRATSSPAAASCLADSKAIAPPAQKPARW